MSRLCCIIGCDSKDLDPDYKQRILFSMTKQREVSWLPVITPYIRSGKASRKNYYLCELHFKSEEVVVKLVPTEDGIRRGGVLVSGAVPYYLKPEEYQNNAPEKRCSTFEHSYARVLDAQTFSATDYMRTLVVDLKEMKANETLPEHWGVEQTSLGLVFLYWGDYFSYVSRSILVGTDLNVLVRGENVIAPKIRFSNIKNKDSVVEMMQSVSRLQLCKGLYDALKCTSAYVEYQSSHDRCAVCRSREEAKRKATIKEKERVTAQKVLKRAEIHSLKSKIKRLQTRLEVAKLNIEEIKKGTLEDRVKYKYANLMSEQLTKLSPLQQEVIETCLTVAKCKGLKGMRYNQNWLIHCANLLMKSRKAYLYLRHNNILPLPTTRTLRRYLIKPGTIRPEGCEDTLLLDEVGKCRAVLHEDEDEEMEDCEEMESDIGVGHNLEIISTPTVDQEATVID